MNEILLSSRLTYLFKLFPFAVFPFLLVHTVISWIDLSSDDSSHQLALYRLVFFSLFTFIIGGVSYWVCVPLEIVKLRNDQLRYGKILARNSIGISEISDIEGPDATTIQRITINLKSSQKIIFIPILFKASRIADNLRELG